MEPTRGSRLKFVVVYGGWLSFMIFGATFGPSWLTGDGLLPACDVVARARWAVLGLSTAILVGAAWCLLRAWRLFLAKRRPLATDAVLFRTRLRTGWPVLLDALGWVGIAGLMFYTLSAFWLSPNEGHALFADDGCQANPWYAWFESPARSTASDCPPPAR